MNLIVTWSFMFFFERWINFIPVLIDIQVLHLCAWSDVGIRLLGIRLLAIAQKMCCISAYVAA